MKRTIRATLVTAVTAVTLGAAIPAHALTPTSTPTSTPTAAAASDPVDPPLYDRTAGGGKVRVNVVTQTLGDVAAAAAAGEKKQEFRTVPVVTLKVDRSGLDRLAAQPGVVSVTEDKVERPTLDESIPLIGGDAALAAGKNGTGQAIAVLDTGVETAHPFLRNRVVAEACFSPSDAESGVVSLCPNGADTQEGTGSADTAAGPCATLADCDHGTHVAGIAAGNGAGITGAPKRGVAPAAGIVAIQVFSEFTTEEFCGGVAPCVGSYQSAQLKGLEHVLKLKQAGTPIVAANLSLGNGRYTTACDTDLRKPVVDSLLSAGVATVIAAGNNGHTDAVSMPGCISSAVTVGSTTDDDELSAFTNRGPLLDLFAPGTSIVSSVPGGTYASKNGTSMAAPHVAGSYAVLKQAFPTKSVAELTALLKSSGRAITYTGATTPRIDLGAAVGGGGNVPKPTGLTDFNGDGAEDIAISDPQASVGTDAKAGLIRIVYGGGKGTAEISQDLDWVPGGSEADDYFGETLATIDWNKDGFTDLVAGTPSETVGTATDAGFVDILYGAAGGLGAGTLKATHLEQGTGTGAIAGSASEAGDRMGHRIAAAVNDAGRPYLVIGVPGEALGTVAQAGSSFYVYGTTSLAISQATAGVPGDPETGDLFGWSVAADQNYIAIGSPNEALGTTAKAGGVVIFDANRFDSTGHPLPLAGLDQDNPAISGGSEAGDQFGYAVAMAPFRAAGAPAATESILAIGSPGESVTVGTEDRANAGRVVQIRIKADGTWSYLRELKQGTAEDDVSGTSETGDRMGEYLTAVNTAPGAVSTVASMRLAVGTPGEDIGTVANAGAVHTFSLAGSAGPNDRWIEAGDGDGIPGSPGANQYLGRSIHFTATRLYVGMPSGPLATGVLYALPMSNVTGGGAVAATTTYKPGSAGLPANGVAFGSTAR
ncbi:S8 family serine peptidase [Streptomyces sp. NPDC002185]|uniref:S8 family serine peptidase n=1 Tax=Streptomyces sp. NPDC002185 TaxID=3364636 RepID=UPI0036ACB3A9